MMRSGVSLSSSVFLEKAALVVVLLFPVSFVLGREAGELVFAVTALLSLYVFFTQTIRVEFSRDEKLLFFSCVLLFLTTVFANGVEKKSLFDAGGLLSSLLIVPAYFFFKNYLKNTSVIWSGLSISLLVVAIGSVTGLHYSIPVNWFASYPVTIISPYLLTDMKLSILIALLIFCYVSVLLLVRLFDNNRQVKLYSLAGLIVFIVFILYSFKEITQQRAVFASGCIFYFAVFLAIASRKKELSNTETVQRSEKLSVIVIAFNEADRIDNCLSSVSGWADEIILFDNGSTDGTIDLAKKYTDKVFVTDWPGYGKQKQRALEQAQHEWVLSIDADEQVTPELRAEIDRVVSSGSKEIAYRIPWAVTIYNKRLDFGRSGRAPLRLFKRAGAKFSEASVHERILLPQGKVGELQERLLHFTHRDLKHSMDKFNKYAWLWATERFNRGKKASMLSALIHGLWMFFVVFFIRLGILDGPRGLLMAVHFGLYTFNKYAALWTLGLQDKK